MDTGPEHPEPGTDGSHRYYTWLRLEDVTTVDGRTGNQRKKGSKLTYNTYNKCNKISSEYHNPNKSRAARLLDSLIRWREEDNK